MFHLGETISTYSYNSRALSVSQELENLATDYARTFMREKEFLELVLTILVGDVELVLAENPGIGAKLYFAEDFDDPHKAPPDVVRSPKYRKQVPGMALEPVRISFGYQVLRLRQGVEQSKVAKDIARLPRLLPLHKTLQLGLPDTLYLQHVVLEKGVHATYPGHGGCAPDDAVLMQPSQALPEKHDLAMWTKPYSDPFSGQTIMSISAPITRPDGSPAGIARMDALLSGLLRARGASLVWAQHVRAILVRPEVDPQTGALGLKSIAEKHSQDDHTDWNVSIEPDWLLSPATDETKWLAEAFKANNSGHFEMLHQGVDSIWGYASLGQEMGLLVIVPKENIFGLAELGRERILWLTQWQWLETGIIAMAVALVLILIAFWRSPSLISPFLVMAEAVQRLAQGDFSVRMDIDKGDERDQVAKAFNEMVPQLEERMRIRKSLEIAQEIQQSLLPEHIPQLPGFDIAARSIYCEQTGGDYFDFMPYGSESEGLGIAVGDVTGHGVGAALLMATARAHIRSLSTKQGDLADHITQVNNLLTADVRRSGNFMSLFFLQLQAESGAIRWVRAGHDPAILYDPADDCFEELTGSGLVLGIEENFSYRQNEKFIEKPGTIILVGTDGIWETHNDDGEMFGKKRLYEIIRKNHERSARAIQEALLQAISIFRGDMGQEDDITIVIVKLDNRHEHVPHRSNSGYH